MSYCNNNTHNINITPKLSYVMEQKSNKESVQADGSDGEKMSADFDDEQGYNVRGFTIDGKVVIETIKEMKIRRVVTDRLQEVEDRLDNADIPNTWSRLDKVAERLDDTDIEDMADRLEIVEDWDASDRLFDVESDLEDLQSRVEALEGKSK